MRQQEEKKMVNWCELRIVLFSRVAILNPNQVFQTESTK